MDRSGELTISKDTIAELNERAAKSNFENTDSYAEYLLSEVLHHLDEPGDAPDKAEVEDRLQSLGYVE